MTDLLGEIRERDALKGHSAAGVTMTQVEADRRTLLRLLDAARGELADAVGKIDRLAIRTIAAEERVQDDADLRAENAELRRQLADTPTTEAAIAKLREWAPDYAAGATHVAMPVVMARRLLDELDRRQPGVNAGN